MEWYFKALEDCGSYKKEIQDIAIRTQILAILIRIFAIYSARDSQKGREGQIQEIIGYINQNLDKPLTLEGLAARFYMSKNHLTAVFKRTTGTTVARYILYKRMARVRRELIEGFQLRRPQRRRDLEIIPAFSEHTKRCLARRRRTAGLRLCRIWTGAVLFSMLLEL